MKKKIGRPKIQERRESVLGVRVTAEEHSFIKQYASYHNKTISQVVLEGLELLYNKEESQKQ